MIFFSQERFDDMADGSTCRGVDFVITIDGVAFKVRNYLETPEEFTVVSPEAPGKSPQTRRLVDYLVSVLGGQRMFFYEQPSEKYREIDLQTLDFKAGENGSSRSRSETHPRGNSNGDDQRSVFTNFKSHGSLCQVQTGTE